VRIGRSVAGCAALLAACAGPQALDAASVDRIHASCSARIASGAALTERSADVGTLRGRAEARERVVIYGADWCGACRMAADYLKERGIPFEEYDIESDAGAHARMLETLKAAKLEYKDALPVMEVGDTVTYGFMPCVVEAAWHG
jgi:glutaredoxin